jgi:hypothetical protein
MDNEKEDLVDKIIKIELDMFLAVPTAGASSCQEHPEAFRRNRIAQFSTWSRKTLSSYRDDLMSARAKGVNLMTMKYARMGKQIPCINDDPLIDKIVEIQTIWQKEMFAQYPRLMRGARAIESREDTDMNTSFESYLRGELETYSENTLCLLYEDVLKYMRDNQSMNERLYDFLVRDLGYASLAEAEKAAGTK